MKRMDNICFGLSGSTILCVSIGIISYFRSNVPMNKVSVIPNAVDSDVFTPNLMRNHSNFPIY